VRRESTLAAFAGLKTAVTMCQTLIQQYKFGIDAISTILSIAKKYGEPLDVLKAIEAYGKLQIIQHQLGEFEVKVNERTELLDQVRSKYQETLDGLESLTARAAEAGTEIVTIEGRVTACKQWRALINLIEDPVTADYAECGDLALLVTVALHKWVSINDGKFKSTYEITSGLQSLIKQLGGVW
jgi:hypothetical protein